MKRWQLWVVLSGVLLATLALLFPPWIARYGGQEHVVDGRRTDSDRSLGHAWIGAPPERIKPDDFEFHFEPHATPEQRRQTPIREAALYAAPEINWSRQGSRLTFIGVVVMLALTWPLRRPKLEPRLLD